MFSLVETKRCRFGVKLFKKYFEEVKGVVVFFNTDLRRRTLSVLGFAGTSEVSTEDQRTERLCMTNRGVRTVLSTTPLALVPLSIGRFEDKSLSASLLLLIIRDIFAGVAFVVAFRRICVCICIFVLLCYSTSGNVLFSFYRGHCDLTRPRWVKNILSLWDVFVHHLEPGSVSVTYLCVCLG